MTIPTPEYNPNVPRPGDSIGTSQPDFLANFASLFTAFAQNHEDLDNTLVGNHTIIEMPAQTANFLSNAGEISVYTRSEEEEGTQVFLKYQGTAEEFQFSCYQIYSVPPIPLPFGGTQTLFFTFLPGRVLLYFGTYSIAIGRVNPGQLTLVPPVATGIITMDFCASGITPFFKPIVTLQVQDNGIISKINLSSPSNLTPITAPSQYIVLAKI